MTYDRKKAVAYALAQVGKKYRFGATGPEYFDCSGLVLQALHQGGKTVQHNSGLQAQELHAVSATAANKKKLLPGDVVFWYGDIDEPKSVSHCGLYVGRQGELWECVAAVDLSHGVKKHRMNWALKPSGFGYVGH